MRPDGLRGRFSASIEKFENVRKFLKFCVEDRKGLVDGIERISRVVNFLGGSYVQVSCLVAVCPIVRCSSAFTFVFPCCGRCDVFSGNYDKTFIPHNFGECVRKLSQYLLPPIILRTDEFISAIGV